MRCWPVLDETIFWAVTGSCYRYILRAYGWDCALTRQCGICYYINPCYWKLLRKDCLTVTPCTALLFIVYTVTDIVYCSDLFTVYTITVDCHIVLLLSLHRPSILSNMILIVLTELNNNVNGQFTLGLGKLMEETASVFWVDLGYRLRSRLKVPLQGSWGMTDISSVMLLFHYFHSEITVTLIEYLAVLSGSAPGNWGSDPGYVWDPPKAWTMSPTDQFQ